MAGGTLQGREFEVRVLGFKLCFVYDDYDADGDPDEFGPSMFAMDLYYGKYEIICTNVWENMEDMFMKELENNEGLVIIVCSCLGKIYKDKNMCERCYIYAEKKDDKCCICRQNEEECWATFSGCGHSIHLRCSFEVAFIEDEMKECPTCRNVSVLDIPIVDTRRQ